MIKKILKKLRDKFLSPVLSKLNELECKFNDPVLSKLNELEYKINTALMTDPVLNKLNELEYKINVAFMTKDNISRIQNDLFDFFRSCYKIYNFSGVEMFLQEIYSLIVKEGDCVIDVGANHGLHTIPLSKLVGKSGKVIACEAVQSYVDDIEGKIDMDNVLFYCAAITKPQVAIENKEISFVYYPDLDGYSGIKGIKDKSHANLRKNIIIVPALTLDKIVEDENLDEHAKISFIKIDIEGGEFDALLGSENILIKYKPVIFFEDNLASCENLYNYTRSEYFEYLNRLGYKQFQFTGGKSDEQDYEKRNLPGAWLVHTESKYMNFFERTYINLAIAYMLKIKTL